MQLSYPPQTLSYITGAMQVLTIIGAGVVAFFHYRMETRLGKFKDDLIEKIDEKFVDKRVAELQYQLLVEKLDHIKTEVALRIEQVEKAGKGGR